MTLTERFLSHVDTAGGACWLWSAHRLRSGYGMFAVTRATKALAHRFAWELSHGPIPPGMVVMHSCDNPPCCNPAHLSLGTHADNVADKIRKGRSTFGERNGMARLREADVLAICECLKRGDSHGTVARTFGLPRSTVTNIATGTRWSHLTGGRPCPPNLRWRPKHRGRT